MAMVMRIAMMTTMRMVVVMTLTMLIAMMKMMHGNENEDELSLKLKNSGFWTFWTSKLTNFKTRLWTRDTCHMDSEGTCG